MGIDSKRLKKSYKHSVLRKQQKELFKPVYHDAPNVSPTASDKEVPVGIQNLEVEDIVNVLEDALDD